MVKMTQSQIKQLVKQGLAIDMTHGNDYQLHDTIDKEYWFDKIAYSVGKYGLNGLLLQGRETKTLYAITKRTSTIFIF